MSFPLRSRVSRGRYSRNSGASSSSVSPTQIAGLQVWVRASDITGKSDGDTIDGTTGWPGSGGTNGLLGVGSLPTYETNEINGRPVVRLASTAALSAVGAKATWNFMHQGDFTFIAVLKATAVTTTQVIFDTAQLTNTNIGMWIIIQNNGQVSCSVVNTAQRVIATSVDASFTSGAFHVLVVRYDNGGTGDDLTIDVDGVSVASGETSGALSGSDSTNFPRLGTRSGTPTSYFAGDIAEVIAYNAALSTGEISGLVGALDSAYGL